MEPTLVLSVRFIREIDLVGQCFLRLEVEVLDHYVCSLLWWEQKPFLAIQKSRTPARRADAGAGFLQGESVHIHEVEIENFRGIAELSWRPSTGLTAIIGHGDSGKTTLLDAIGLLFSPRWNPVFSDNDFHMKGGDVDEIVIRATVVDPPTELMRMENFIGYIRGVNPLTGEVVDEPDHEDPALTVELRVDRYLEPIWHAIADRQPEPAQLRTKHRAAFGIARIQANDSSDLRWARNSVLLRMTGIEDRSPTSRALVDASRAAKNATQATFAELDGLAERVTREARILRAVDAQVTLNAAINSDSFQLNEGAVSLHADGVPMERHGLGTRRLTSAAAQLTDFADARVLLVDEAESGLEPHRIRHLLRALDTRLQSEGPLKQVFVTTHSPVVIRELHYSQLSVMRAFPEKSILFSPEENMQRILRANAESFLAPNVLVCEGATEVGFARGVYSWAEGKNLSVIVAVAPADANGESNIVEYASAFAALGYRVAIFCDHDTDLVLDGVSDDTTIIRSDIGKCTEQQMAGSLGQEALRLAILHGIEAFGEDSINSKFQSRDCPRDLLQEILGSEPMNAMNLEKLRSALGTEAGYGRNTSKWFKSVSGGERLAEIVLLDPEFTPQSQAGRIVSELESWGKS